MLNGSMNVQIKVYGLLKQNDPSKNPSQLKVRNAFLALAFGREFHRIHIQHVFQSLKIPRHLNNHTGQSLLVCVGYFSEVSLLVTVNSSVRL